MLLKAGTRCTPRLGPPPGRELHQMCIRDRNRQDPAPGYTLRAPKIITAFELNHLSPTVSGIIDQENKTIRVLVPDGTDINNLVPTITFSGQTITPDTEEAQDFSDQVSYTVTAEDQSQQTYTVTVIIKEKDPFIVSVNGVDSITAVSYTHLDVYKRQAVPLWGVENNRGSSFTLVFTTIP